jgi:flagellar motor switch protein FliG
MASATDQKQPGQTPHPVPPPAANQPLTLRGAVKAALWLLSAEEEVAVSTLQHLNSDEVRRLRHAAETLQKYSPDQLAMVHQEFRTLLEQQPLRVRGSLEYLSKLGVQAWGETKAAALLRPVHEKVPPATMLLEADLDALTLTLVEEHPQIIAAVLTTLTPERASEILGKFPEDLKGEVLTRLARLTRVPQASLARAQQILSAGLPVVETQDYDVDGVRVAATLLNQVATEEADKLLKAVAQEKEELASEVRQAMFTFEDLGKLDRRGVQTLLKDVPADRLLLALKAASDELKQKIFDGLSKRASEMMKEDLNAMGPAKLADVEAAQAEVVAVALKLREEGKITVVGQGGDFV